MISIIVCSAREPSWNLHELNSAATAGIPIEYIRVDNRRKKSGICAAYNYGVARSRGDLIVFMHEDAFFMESGWGPMLQRKFAADPLLGLLGVAGTRYLGKDRMAWTAAGRPYLEGRVVQELQDSGEFFMSAFSVEPGDREVVAVDGLFFAIRRELFGAVSFDEMTFDGYHFYDLDICMQVRQTHRLAVTWDILLKHFSAGNPDDTWRLYGRRFLEKWRGELPANCSDTEPDFSAERKPGLKFDLRGKARTGIVCSSGLVVPYSA
jgi:hypothetical protein